MEFKEVLVKIAEINNTTKDNWHSWNKVFSPAGATDMETFVNILTEILK